MWEGKKEMSMFIQRNRASTNISRIAGKASQRIEITALLKC